MRISLEGALIGTVDSDGTLVMSALNKSFNATARDDDWTDLIRVDVTSITQLENAVQ